MPFDRRRNVRAKGARSWLIRRHRCRLRRSTQRGGEIIHYERQGVRCEFPASSTAASSRRPSHGLVPQQDREKGRDHPFRIKIKYPSISRSQNIPIPTNGALCTVLGEMVAREASGIFVVEASTVKLPERRPVYQSPPRRNYIVNSYSPVVATIDDFMDSFTHY